MPLSRYLKQHRQSDQRHKVCIAPSRLTHHHSAMVEEARVWGAFDAIFNGLRDMRAAGLRFLEALLLAALQDFQRPRDARLLLNSVFELAYACSAVAAELERCGRPDIGKRIMDSGLELEMSTAGDWAKIADGTFECTPHTRERIRVLENSSS